MSGHGAAAQALAGIDEVLAKRPHKDDAALADVVRQLCTHRDALIARRRRPDRTAEDSRRLDHLNAVLSVVMAMAFPLGPAPWSELEKARVWLAALAEGSPTEAT